MSGAADSTRSCEAPARLARRIASGSAAAEAELVERYRRGVEVILRRHLGDRPEVDDLAQETFRLALVKIRRGEVRDPRRLSGFVTGLARNLAREQWRRQARQPTAAENATERLADRDDSPLGRLLAEERGALVRQVLGELDNERDRQLLLRFYLGEENKEDLCHEFGLDSLHFNRVLHRARRRYRERYESAVARSGGGRELG